jgi:hypothetical protein
MTFGSWRLRDRSQLRRRGKREWWEGWNSAWIRRLEGYHISREVEPGSWEGRAAHQEGPDLPVAQWTGYRLYADGLRYHGGKRDPTSGGLVGKCWVEVTWLVMYLGCVEGECIDESGGWCDVGEFGLGLWFVKQPQLGVSASLETRWQFHLFQWGDLLKVVLRLV